VGGRGKSHPVVLVLQAAAVCSMGAACLWIAKPGGMGDGVPFPFQKHVAMVDQPHRKNVSSFSLEFAWHPSLATGGCCALFCWLKGHGMSGSKG